MGRIKNWLEGTTLALISWAMVVTLSLSISIPAHADVGSLFTTWEHQSTNRGNYEAYDRAFCTDVVVGRGITALSAYRKSGGFGVSYSVDGQCMDTWGGWNSLEDAARDDWDECRDWVDANFYMRSWDINTGNNLIGIGITVAIFVLGIAVGYAYGEFVDEYKARRQAKDMICGSSVDG